MEYFPQLETGAMGQYPLRRTRRVRTIENRMPGGESIRFADAAAEVTEWRLEFRALTDGEADSVSRFFEAMEGRLRPFTFLDPAGNLLAWSEKLDEAAWSKNPLTTVAAGVADPHGGTRAWRIGGPAPAGISQTLTVPDAFEYCVSVYARCDGRATVGLLRGGQRSEQPVTSTWKRLTFAGAGEGSGESVRFGLELPAGGTIEVFGFQVEPQAGASGYKRTTSRTGVFRNARFGQDRLQMTATAAGRHNCLLSVIHGEHI